MAMNKTEKEAVERLLTESALRRTAPVSTDVEIPNSGAPLTKGFLFCAEATDGQRVAPACSSSTGHNFGSDKGTSSQRPMRLYSTRLLALRALRNAAESRCARYLREIDRWIEDEVSGQVKP
jgi:hypothetical protein